MTPKTMETTRCIPLSDTALPNRPNKIPKLMYPIVLPILYCNEEKNALNPETFLLECTARANGPHMPMQCKLPKNPRVNAIQYNI